MPTLLEALSDGSIDLQNKRDMSTDFAKKLVTYRDVIVSDYLKYGIDLNLAIAKIAKKNQLNDDQIQRIIEEVNNQVYLIEYDKMKDSNEREVEFDIASLGKVKDKCNDSVPDTKIKDTENSKDNDSTDKIEKKASTDCIDSSNAFNGVLTNKFGDLSSGFRKSKEEFLIDKIASRVRKEEDMLDKIAKDIKVNCYELGDAIVKLDRHGCDCNEILSGISKSANFTNEQLDMIKIAYETRISTLKSERKLPEDYKLDLKLNLEKTASEKYSLGRYSFMKEASDSNKEMPTIILETGKTVKCVNDLMKIASDLNDNTRKIKEGSINLNNIIEKCAHAGISSEMLEKSAGLFSNALGVGKRVARNNLDDAINNLQKLTSKSTVYSAAKNNVDDLMGKMKDIDGLIPGAKQGLEQAQRNASYVTQKNQHITDKALNQGFIKNLFDKEVRSSNKEISSAKNKLNKAKSSYDKQYSDKMYELSGNINKAKADLNLIEDVEGISNANKKIADAQKAYDKATRSTRQARTTLAGGGAIGLAGLNSISKPAKKPTQPQQQFVDYSNDTLNNGFQ